MNYFRLQISSNPDKNIYDSISEILGVKPMQFEPTKKITKQLYNDWTYELQMSEEDEYIDFINIFLDLIEPNMTKLKELNISIEDILIWKLYEYEHQCALSFTPQEMKRIGDLGIHLNIDCWSK